MKKQTKKGINVILTKNIENQGNQGTLVKVKPGYFRNYIIPLKLGKKATPNLISQLEIQEKKSVETKKNFLDKCITNKALLENLNKFEIVKKVGDKGKIFGKITNKQIIELIKNEGNLNIELTKNQIQLPEIKEPGEYIVDINLAKEVIAKINIEILSE